MPTDPNNATCRVALHDNICAQHTLDPQPAAEKGLRAKPLRAMAAPAPDAGPSEDERGLKRPLGDGGIDAETEERALLSIKGFLLRALGGAAVPLPPKGVAEAILKNADCHSFLAECMAAIGESGEV